MDIDGYRLYDQYKLSSVIILHMKIKCKRISGFGGNMIKLFTEGRRTDEGTVGIL